MADRVVKCLPVLHNTVDDEASDEASVLELENFQESFYLNHDASESQIAWANNQSSLRVKKINRLFTVCFNSDLIQLHENNRWTQHTKWMGNKQWIDRT